MKKAITLSLLLIALISTSGFSQQQEMYTFCVGGNYAYLLDTSAATTSSYYKRWTLASTTGYSAYFLNDTVYQSVAYTASTTHPGQGGITGKVRKIAWDGTKVWEYAASSTTTQMHHDICPMPNGNVLLIVYESKTAAECTAKGCSSPPSGGMWSEKIIEVKPTGATTGTIVWEWHLWDHLCQNVNSAITSTYVSSIASNPERLNINYNVRQDWIHMNGIDYNASLDQIMFSSHYMNEVYVIDHSTTTAEAASHSGGNGGKGGDFLYRWGNPAAYGCTAGGNNSGFNVIHDAHWVPASNSMWPNYMCAYNNNNGTSNVQVVLWQPPYNGYNYSYTPGSIIGPTTCTKPTIPAITASNEGNSQQLDNGNILVTKPGIGGGSGTFYECNGSGTTYQTVSVKTSHAYRIKKCQVRFPVASANASSSSICLGDAVTLSSSAISITETSPTYTYSWSASPAGFSSNSQNPSDTPTAAGTYTYLVNVTNTAVGCSDTASVNITVEACSDINDDIENSGLTIFPNPTMGIVYLDEAYATLDFDAFVYNSFGKLIVHEKNTETIDLSAFSNGVYYLTLITNENKAITKKIILIK